MTGRRIALAVSAFVFLVALIFCAIAGAGTMIMIAPTSPWTLLGVIVFLLLLGVIGGWLLSEMLDAFHGS